MKIVDMATTIIQDCDGNTISVSMFPNAHIFNFWDILVTAEKSIGVERIKGVL